MRTPTISVLALLVSASLTAAGCGGAGGGDGPVTVTRMAIEAQTGHVTSGGITTTFGDVDFGDMANGQSRRGFVSFDVSGIPSDATVLSATLTLTQYYVGGSPYTKLGSALVDHVVYGTILEAGAYARSPLVSAFATLSVDATLGPKSIAVTAQVQNDLISGHPQSQYRVRFPTENSGDTVEDFVDCYAPSINSPAGSRPTLVITYK